MTDLVFSSVPNNNQSPVDIVFSTGETPQQIDWRSTYNNIVDSTNEIKRLLYNIETIKNAAEKLYTLNGVFYTQNKFAEQFGYNDYQRQVGVIAQEVQKIMPEVVKPAPFDVTEDGGSKSGEYYLTVMYERLIPLIVETIKEQQKEIEELEKLNGN